jgi:hypothetical protein
MRVMAINNNLQNIQKLNFADVKKQTKIKLHDLEQVN